MTCEPNKCASESATHLMLDTIKAVKSCTQLGTGRAIL